MNPVWLNLKKEKGKKKEISLTEKYEPASWERITD